MPKTTTKKTETKTKAPTLRAHQKALLKRLVAAGTEPRANSYKERGLARLSDLGLVTCNSKSWKPTAAGKKLAATFA